MQIEDLIRQRVNDSRGGYEPSAVKEMMRAAFELGKRSAHGEAADALTELAGDRGESA